MVEIVEFLSSPLYRGLGIEPKQVDYTTKYPTRIEFLYSNFQKLSEKGVLDNTYATASQGHRYDYLTTTLTSHSFECSS